MKRRVAATIAVVAITGATATAADASTAPPGDQASAAYRGLRNYLAAIADTELTDEDGLVVGDCPLITAEEFRDVSSLGGSSVYVVDQTVVMPLTVARLGDRVSVQCSLSGGVGPGVARADITVLDLAVSPEIERQLDQVMRGASWEPAIEPRSGEFAGRCYARRDHDVCPVAWKHQDLAVLIEMQFGPGAGDAARARLVFGALLARVLSNLAALS